MSCNGCRVLRKGCSDTCVLRPCLQWIESSESQGYATVFVAKFFGRAGLMGFISAVPDSQRPALFQSLLYEACGRTVNPVFGAVGLLWNGNWQVCQAAVDTVLKGGQLQPRSPSTCLPANLGATAPCIPAFPTSGNFPFPMAGRVDDPTQMKIPFGNENAAPRQDTNFGVDMSEPKAMEAKERAANDRHSKERRGEANGEQCWNEPLMNGEPKQRDRVQFEGPAHVVPRRVRARVESLAVQGFGERAHEELLMPTDGGEQLELDLTLKVKGGKTTGVKRLSSPCDSVNSEGSVTSLDTTLREPSRAPSWAFDTTHTAAPSRKLLPLLQ